MIFSALNQFVTEHHEKNPDAPTLLAKPACLDSTKDKNEGITYRKHVNNLERLGFVFQAKPEKR